MYGCERWTVKKSWAPKNWCFWTVVLEKTLKSPLDWWTGRLGMLRFMGSQRVGHDWATELNWYIDMQIYIHICIYTHHSFKFQKHCRISEDCLGANHHFFQEVPHVQETTQYMVKYLHYLIFSLNSIWLAFDSNVTFESRLIGVTLKSHLIPIGWHLIPLLLLCFVFPENLICIYFSAPIVFCFSWECTSVGGTVHACALLNLGKEKN